jgi:hypothetical protein
VKQQLLIFAWEYDGYHSISGAALSRRVRQVAESFEKNNWNVVVIHRDQRNECGQSPYKIQTEVSGVRRIAVKSTKNISDFSKFALLRRLQTFYYVTFRGDRSSCWADNVIKYYNEFDLPKPDLIIGFFTPRAPLFLGNYFAAKLNTQWIADLQDNFDHGISGILMPENKNWTKNILKSAHAVVHVSTEWAARDGDILGLNIKTIRHAVPEVAIKSATRKDNAPFTIFYGGSLSKQDQSLFVLKKVINDLPALPRAVELLVAGTEQTYDFFRQNLDTSIIIKNMGWLSKEDYNKQLADCDCSLVIPWSSEPRQVVPSKFYELCGYGKPIWIVGNDTGAFSYLLNEWKHPELPTANISFQQKALLSALHNDFSMMFNIGNCADHYIKETDLFRKFIELV